MSDILQHSFRSHENEAFIRLFIMTNVDQSFEIQEYFYVKHTCVFFRNLRNSLVVISEVNISKLHLFKCLRLIYSTLY
jgi:hypothetical protein